MGKLKTLIDKEAKLVLSNISVSLVLKSLSLVLSLIITKRYIIYFDNNVVLGGWYALVSILNWILYFDLGIGNGIRNKIVSPLENKDYGLARRYISTGYIVVGAISLIVLVIGGILSFTLNWNSILNLSLSEVSNNTLSITVFVSFLGISIHFALKVIMSVYQAMRKTAVTGLTALCTNLFLLLYLRFFHFDNAEVALIAFAVAYALATNIPIIAVTIYSFWEKMKMMRPAIKLYDKRLAKDVFSLGISFFGIQIAQLFVSSTDSWLITYFYDPAYTVDYQIYYRIFSIVLTAYALFSQTTWSSITKYYDERNGKKIKQEYLFMVCIAGAGILASTVVAFNFNTIVDMWMSGVDVKVSVGTALLFVAWFGVQMLVNAATAVANGIGQLKCQAIFYIVAAVIKIVGVIILSHYGCDWVSTVVCNIVSLLPLLIVQTISIIKIFKLNFKGES